jgi:DUF177 domain-containing protein
VPRGAFVVSVARLRRRSGASSHVAPAGPIADLQVTGTAVPEGADVAADVTLETIAGGIAVRGVVTAPWTGTCRRCLVPLTGRLEVPVRELYTEGGDGEDTYPLAGDEVDLEPLARDAVLLDLPVAPLCRPNCKGLCPICGADLNEVTCGCGAPRDPRWAALDALKDEAGPEV